MFKLPSFVLKKVVDLQRKIAWASWEKVCESREAGGLGMINIKFFNLALLSKWIWRWV